MYIANKSKREISKAMVSKAEAFQRISRCRGLKLQEWSLKFLATMVSMLENFKSQQCSEAGGMGAQRNYKLIVNS